jgi:hypothetical protein
LLPNNTATEMFLHKSGEVKIVDWIFVTGGRPGGDCANT